jgi:hypothetical protein
VTATLPLLAQLWITTAAPDSGDLVAGTPGEVEMIELSWARAQALREAAADDSPPWPTPWASKREIELVPVEGGLELRGRWTIESGEAGWLAGELLGPGFELQSATLDGKVAPVLSIPGRSTLVMAWLPGGRDVELRVRALLPTSLDDRLELALLPATRGSLRAAVPGRVLVPAAEDGLGGGGDEGHAAPTRLGSGVVWSGAERVDVWLRDPSGAAPAPHDALAVAHVGVGLTVGDAEVRGRARVQWELRHGTLSRVRASVAGVGDDLALAGPAVSSWSRSGDVIDVELSGPTSGRVAIELQWTQAIGAGEEHRVSLPVIEPEAWRSESSLQLARDGELEVIPSELEGTAIPASALPEWGQGLVEGTPTAAYQRPSGPTSGALDLLRFVPVPGPPSVVDLADYTVATTEEGRVLLKARYELRNDRAAHLTVRPPPGLEIIGARVGVDSALPSKGDAGAWRIPLRRSLETVDGLLSFPVEVIMLGEQAPWARRERRELPLPTLDAPIASAHVTLFLPPRYRSRLEPGERNVVEAFDDGTGEGLSYGRGISGKAEVSDVLLEEAVQGYLKNDFEGAQRKLEEIEALGVDNANVARLRSNIAVIEGETKAADKDVTLQRRVKEQAKARASNDFRKQEVLIEEAEKAAQAGDYAQAEAQYQAALDLGGKLAKLEQTESVEQVTRNVKVQAELSTVSKKKGKRSKKDEPATTSIPSSLGDEGWSEPSPAGNDDGDLTPSLDPAPEPNVDQEALLGPEPNEPLAPPPPEALVDLPAPSMRARRAARRGIKLKAAEPRRARRDDRALELRMDGGGGGGDDASEDAGVAVYDFADDSIDGMVLTPEGSATEAAAPKPTLGAIAPPKVHASAMSVLIPITGRSVRYQQLLIEANQTQVIEIHARRRLRR